MKESQFGFSYTWQDLKPVWALAISVIVFQVIGATLLYLLVSIDAHWFQVLWMGGAIATLPGYIVGLLLQHRIDVKSINHNKTMVYRLGMIAVVLTLVGLFVPDFGLLHSL